MIVTWKKYMPYNVLLDTFHFNRGGGTYFACLTILLFLHWCGCLWGDSPHTRILYVVLNTCKICTEQESTGLCSMENG